MSIFTKTRDTFPNEQDLRDAYVWVMPVDAASQVTLALVDHYKSTEARVRSVVADRNLPMTMLLLDEMSSQVRAMELLSASGVSEIYAAHLIEFKHHAIANLASDPSTTTDQAAIIHDMEEALSHDG